MANAQPAPSDEERLRSWVARALEGDVVRWERLVSGNSRSLWAVDVQTGAERIPLVVRCETGTGPLEGTELTLAREAGIYAALNDSGLPVPNLHAFDTEQQAMVIGRLPGSADWSDAVLDGLLAELGRLHCLDVARFDPLLPGGSALDDVDLWTRIAAACNRPPSVYVETALMILRDRFPGEPSRLVVCHGDAGPGNVLHDGSVVSALLDWEFAHLGDPHDDLAWITVRAALYGIELPEFGARVRAHYQPIAHIEPESERLAYWQAVVVLRNLIICLASISNPLRGRDRLIHFMLVPPLHRLLVGTLARLAGVVLEPPEKLGPGESLPGMEVLREIADTAGDLAATIDNGDARSRLARMRHLLSQLSATLPLAHEIRRRNAGESAFSTDAVERLPQLARLADRELLLYPRAAAIAYAELAQL